MIQTQDDFVGRARANWELTILDAHAPQCEQLGSLAVGDIDGDGAVEVLVGGVGALNWYRPATREQGVIAEGHFQVGLTLEDLDGDGLLEAVVGRYTSGGAAFELLWIKPQKDLNAPWTVHRLDPTASGHAHDLCFADIDGDGERELIASAVYCKVPGLYLYKRNSDMTAPWRKHAIQTGYAEEGLAVGDLDGDGKPEIVSGPDWYAMPPDGPFAGPWQRHIFAPSFREMCRAAIIDITGNGRPDILLTDSEYMDGQLSWFENRLLENPEDPWIEHPIERPLIYSHSLAAWRDAKTGNARVFVGEMAEGGWSAPRNHEARLIEYVTADQGKTWQREVLYQGAGTHQATVYDVDGDGEMEVVGKDCWIPTVQLWKRSDSVSPLTRFRHRFLDRDKSYTATDILAADVDGDGRQDVLCGGWWYQNPTWEKRGLPGIYQVLCAYDLDGDGRQEVIAIKGKPDTPNGYGKLNSDLCWLKPTDPRNGQWEEYVIGVGAGDWPHGALVAPLLPGGQLALVTGYHDAGSNGVCPEIWQIPADPRTSPWPKRTLMDIAYGEEFLAQDIDGDGKLDLVAGPHWLENLGDGNFRPHRIAEGFQVARIALADINGDGRVDVVMGEEALDFQKRVTPYSRLAWFEQPADPRAQAWPMHIIDRVRCPHSVAVADLDGDGEMEVICGEHDPFWPYRKQCRLYAYQKADPQGRSWKRYVLDDRFEHHDGTKIIELAAGRLGILSHGWTDSLYVHLWELNTHA